MYYIEIESKPSLVLVSSVASVLLLSATRWSASSRCSIVLGRCATERGRTTERRRAAERWAVTTETSRRASERGTTSRGCAVLVGRSRATETRRFSERGTSRWSTVLVRGSRSAEVGSTGRRSAVLVGWGWSSTSETTAKSTTEGRALRRCSEGLRTTESTAASSWGSTVVLGRSAEAAATAESAWGWSAESTWGWTTETLRSTESAASTSRWSSVVLGRCSERWLTCRRCAVLTGWSGTAETASSEGRSTGGSSVLTGWRRSTTTESSAKALATLPSLATWGQVASLGTSGWITGRQRSYKFWIIIKLLKYTLNKNWISEASSVRSFIRL